MPTFVGYILLFVALAVFFVFIHLVMGRFLRPVKPDADKLTIYECGEPTIGSAWIQFDLRFYVVALLFVIFDVEVAFFFPWAVVFGQANAVAKNDTPAADNATLSRARRELLLVNPNAPAMLSPSAAPAAPGVAGAPARRQAGMGGLSLPAGEMVGDAAAVQQEAAHELAKIAFYDILVFFGVLLVGFAYLWRRGDINWVRSIAAEKEDEEEAAHVPPVDSPSSLKTIVDGSLQTISH
jgi:NADH-quinone oxidoreductase subunit A